MPRFFKAVTKDGRIALRSTENRIYASAFVHDGGKPGQLLGSGMSNWASEGCTPPEARRHKGEICLAVEITGKEYRELRK